MKDDVNWGWRECRMAEMHEAICAGNREKAIELMQELFPKYGFRTLDEQRRIWPDRVPA